MSSCLCNTCRRPQVWRTDRMLEHDPYTRLVQRSTAHNCSDSSLLIGSLGILAVYPSVIRLRILLVESQSPILSSTPLQPVSIPILVSRHGSPVVLYIPRSMYSSSRDFAISFISDLRMLSLARCWTPVYATTEM